MRYAVFGDVHANYDALKAVLADLEEQKPDAVLCTGDLVGYGAEPARCMEAVVALDCPVVAGNHEYAVIGKTDVAYFNREAMEGVMWTRAHLTADEVAAIRQMPLTLRLDAGLLVHSTPADPAEFGYIFSLPDAARAFNAMDEAALCFVGHSHIPMAFWLHDGIKFDTAPSVDLRCAEKAIINVGSVGQPRDRDPRAAYAIYDADARVLEVRRVAYDVASAARRILEAGLPDINAYRLAVGQ